MIILDRLPYLLLMIFSAIGCGAIAIRAYWLRRKVARAASFSMMAICASIWMLMVALDTITTDLAWREVLWGLIPVAILNTLIGLFFFSLEFSLRLSQVPKTVLFPTVFITIAICSLSVTNPFHHQLWTVSQVNGIDIQVMGNFFVIQLTFTYLLIFACLILLARAYLLSTGVLRRQSGLLLVGLLVPLLVSIGTDVLGWNPLPFIDEPAFSIVVTVVLFGLATLRFDTFYLLPVASDVIIKNMQEGVLVTDIEGLIIFSNPAAHQALGKTEEQLHDYSVANVLADWLPAARQAWDERKEETQLVLGEEEAQYYLLTISKLAGNASKSVGYLLTLTNNSYQKNYEKKLNELAGSDPLTGSYNRRFFYEVAQVYFNQMLRSVKPLSIIMLDLDHFKQINDTYGHLKGDIVLQQVTYVCKKLVRVQDIFSRFGGEEFVIALPETSLSNAMLVAERLRRAIEALKIEFDDIHITASFGVAETIGETDLSLDILINRADEAMYVAKHAGRNQVAAWEKV
jgi:diguanylate cyclase (GGDEF)-like protein